MPDSSVALALLLTVAVVALQGSPVEAATYHVDDDSCPGPGSGTPGDPFCSIQAGIDAASAGDTVQVAAGTYLETITMKSGVVIQGAGQGDTIIDGGGSGSVVTAIGVDSAATLDGFTITNGQNVDGGGMYNSGSSPTVSNCTFSGNSAFLLPGVGAGGGMYNADSSPTVTSCTFSGNDASGAGGGMYNLRSSAILTDCTFSDNTAYEGGGMYNLSSSPTVTRCSFTRNESSASAMGGGMINDASSPTVSACRFFDNYSGALGGGIVNRNGSSPIVANCIFSQNRAGSPPFGRDMVNFGASSPTVINCTFWNEGGEVMYNDHSSPTVTNCIFWGHFLFILNVEATPSVTYSVIPDAGTGNIWAGVDPGFVDAANGDFHLRPFSPCIDAGDNSNPALPATDIDGDDRRIDDPTVADTGAGEPPIVDMGADEFDPWASIFGDGFESGDVASWSATLGEAP